MYVRSILLGLLVLDLVGAFGIASARAQKPPQESLRPKRNPLVRRLRPLHMNLYSRAHVRGAGMSRAVRESLRADLQRREARFQPAWTAPASRLASPSPSPRTAPRRRSAAAPARSAVAPWARGFGKRPRRPLLRKGVGYPLPPWLKGIRLPDIPIRFTSQVYRYLAYYRTSAVGRSVLRHWLGRMKRFEGLIRAELRRHGLPESLIYVSMIESSFRPTTVSRAGAAGLWQFMPYGGAIYGLKRTFWVDERLNPDRSTRAVMYYFKDLYRRFGNWEMALAAFNAGYGGVMRAVRKYNTNDYWRLCDYEAGLPYETMAYVPKFFAIAVVAENLDRFDLHPGKPAAPWEYALVSVRGGTTLKRVAQLTQVPLKTLASLNPELRRKRVPPGKNYELRIPPSALATYQRAAAAVQAGTRRLQAYKVRYGDSVTSIARAFGVSAGLIRRINHIRSRSEVRPGVTLLLPKGRSRRARRAARNNRQLVALPLVKPPSPNHERIFYPVVTGDRLPDVARALGVALTDLRAWNAVTETTRLFSGMVLQGFVKPGHKPSGVRLLDPASLRVVPVNSKAFHEAHLKQHHRRRLVIRARSGDTLRRVARRYGISVGSLARENKLSRYAKLRAGQRIVVYTRGRRRHHRRRHRRRHRRHH